MLTLNYHHSQVVIPGCSLVVIAVAGLSTQTLETVFCITVWGKVNWQYFALSAQGSVGCKTSLLAIQIKCISLEAL